MSKAITVTLSVNDWDLIAEALNSHLYWQVSDKDRRSSGYVMDPLTAEEQHIEDLENTIRDLIKGAE